MKIQVLDQIANIADSMLDNGKLFLDLNRQDALEFSRVLSQLSEINNIRDEAALSLTFPYSEKNKAIADFVRNHNLTGKKYEPIAVLVQEGAIVHRLNYLQFTGANDETEQFEAQLERGPGHWLHDANRLLLKDIPFAEFELTFDALLNNWQENSRYENAIDNAGYYWPLVNYGGWLRKDAVMPEDLRPWFHVLALLEKGFCEIGWNFRTPFYETEFGQRLICYLLSENLLEVPEVLALRKFKATAQSVTVDIDPSATGQHIIFSAVQYDPSAGYNASNGRYYATGIFTFSSALELTHAGPPGPLIVTLERVAVDGTRQVLDQYELNTDAPAFIQTHTVVLQAEDVQMAYGDYVHVTCLAFTQMIVTGYFDGFAQKAYLERGMVINPASLISGELTLLDLYKAASHLCAGKTFTDWERQTVWLYAPNKTDIFTDTGVQGFFKDENIVDITDIVLPRSELVTLERTNKKRYLVLQFADSSDEHIKKIEEGRSFPIYSKVVDRGNQYEEGFEYSKNPLFQATVNKALAKFPVVPPFIVPNNEVDIPHCSDNDNGSISYKIGFRVLYCAGYQRQRTDTGEVRRWRIVTTGNNSTGMQNVPYAFQVPNARIGPDPGAVPVQRLIYGDDDGRDLYTMAYKQELIDRLYSVRAGFKALVDAYNYKQLSFRDLYKLHYNGRTFLARLLEINARRTCTDGPAEIVLRPTIWGGDLCAEKETVKYQPETCPNYPEINISINVAADTITATAQDAAINDPIITDVWEYSTDGGSTWSNYTEGQAISGFPEVTFRRTVSFDAEKGDCSQVVTKTAVFETVCDNTADIVLSYDPSKNGITATADGTFNSPIASDVWSAEIDHGSAQTYTPGSEVNGFTHVKFTRTVSFANSCEASTVEKEYEVQGDQCNNAPELELVEVADCVYDVQVSGSTSSAICMSFIEVSNNDGAKWLAWDGYPIKGEAGKKVRATFQFCDSCPPIYIEKDCPFI
ncbi:hypothetical protein KC887_00645 [Candidatus Kaiserbacteria bacterium]|nr:hypothetical protein [Candidatus Kaiserbacteria bacterium]